MAKFDPLPVVHTNKFALGIGIHNTLLQLVYQFGRGNSILELLLQQLADFPAFPLAGFHFIFPELRLRRSINIFERDNAYQ